jgi:hypothetical protein
MFARTAAAKVIAGKQNLRALLVWLIQDEFWTRVTLRVVAPIIKQHLPQCRLVGHLQKAGWDDLIGIYVLVCKCDDARA